MAIMILGDGPIDRYIREVGITRDTFENRLRHSDPGAMALFGAEAVCRAIGDLTSTIENSEMARAPRRRRE